MTPNIALWLTPVLAAAGTLFVIPVGFLDSPKKFGTNPIVVVSLCTTLLLAWRFRQNLICRSENSMITYSTGAGRSVLAQWRGRLRHAQQPV
jgi:hypothetical protein